MNIQYFGQYLLLKGYITKEQLLLAIEHQKVVNVKIGTLAVDSGLMTFAQVEKVLLLQKNENKQFGEIAIENNFLTKQQLSDIVLKQKEERVFLGEALISKGFLNLENIDKYLKEYHEEQKTANKAISLAIEGLDPRFSDFVDESIQVFQNMVVRLLDENGKVSGCYSPKNPPPPSGYIIFQKVFGEKNFIIALNVKEKELLNFSSKMLKQKVEEIDELCQDGVKEFLNIVIGHICVGLSNKGIKTETAPPVFINAEQFSSELVYSSLAVISILLIDGKFDLHFYLI